MDIILELYGLILTKPIYFLSKTPSQTYFCNISSWCPEKMPELPPFIFKAAAPQGELPDSGYRQGEETLPQSDEVWRCGGDVVWVWRDAAEMVRKDRYLDWYVQFSQ